MSNTQARPGFLPGVDWSAGIERMMGNEVLYRKLLATFADTYRDADMRIWEALATGERQTAREELHTLKGVTANLALVPLADLVRQAEQAVKNDDTANEAACMTAMCRELASVIKTLKKL